MMLRSGVIVTENQLANKKNATVKQVKNKKRVMYNALTEFQIKRYHRFGKVRLVNLGMTCYMNSILQCLFYSTNFSNFVITKVNKHFYWYNLAVIFAKMHYCRKHVIRPTYMFDILAPPGVQILTSQDCTEFFGHLLGLLQENEQSSEYRIQPKDRACKRLNCPSFRLPRVDYELPETGESKPLTYVEEMFRVTSVTHTICQGCSNGTSNRDAFCPMNLAFPEGPFEERLTVQDLINYYCRSNKTTPDDKYTCGVCSHTEATRTCYIESTSKYLVVATKNYNFVPRTGRVHKTLEPLTCSEIVTLPMLNGDDMPFLLYAVIVHVGRFATGGHYMVLAKIGGEWHIVDDTSDITPNTLESIDENKSAAPYMLFYRRFDVKEEEPITYDDIPNHILTRM